jgi:ribosomal protein S18 acetylase RimI-like enzyme
MPKSIISKLSGANMDIDLMTPINQIFWHQDSCPWNSVDGHPVHHCAVKNVSICPYFCGVAHLDVVLCSYPHHNPYSQEPAPPVFWKIQGPEFGKAEICKPIIEDLPAWFGIPAANRQYMQEIEVLPTFLGFHEGVVVGFLSVREHSSATAEVHILGVRKAYHRQGIGTALLRAVEGYLGGRQVEFLQVKTLSASHPDPNYARTRAFYQAMGFKEFEELPTLWGQANPCLIMVKSLGR